MAWFLGRSLHRQTHVASKRCDLSLCGGHKNIHHLSVGEREIERGRTTCASCSLYIAVTVKDWAKLKEGSDEKAECNWMSDGECVWGIHVVRAADDYRLQCYKKFDKWKVTDGFNVCSLGFVRQIDSSMGELSDRAASHGENPRILADNSTDGLRGSKSKSFARGRQLYARQTNIVIIVLSILPCSPYTVLREAGQSFTLLDSSSSLLVFKTNQNVHLGL